MSVPQETTSKNCGWRRYFFLGAILGLACGIGIGLLLAASGLVPSSEKAQDNFGYFIGQPETRMLADGETFELLADFVYVDPKQKVWTAKQGSATNGASIPRPFWTIVGAPATGKYRFSAVIHDAACEDRNEAWEDVHHAFYLGCRAEGVPKAQANMLYAAVYHFGPRWVLETASEVRMVTLADGTDVQIPVEKKYGSPIVRAPILDEDKAIEFIKSFENEDLSPEKIREQSFEVFEERNTRR